MNDAINFLFQFVQSSGAKFYNFITGSSLELRTNVFDAESSLLDIGRSITAAAGSEPDKVTLFYISFISSRITFNKRKISQTRLFMLLSLMTWMESNRFVLQFGCW